MSSIKELVKKIEKNQKPSQKNAAQEKQGKQEKGEDKSRSGKKVPEKKEFSSKNFKKEKKDKKKRFFVVQVCTSQKSCGNHYGPYIWERLCNDYGQDPESESFEIQGFRFEKSPCQGACKKASNIRVKDMENKNKPHTQFSYITPLKASKLIKNIKSGATPDNIKKI